MKVVPCKVIEDLLPIYHDGVCSEDSRALVDEHLRECQACRDTLMQIDQDLEIKVSLNEKQAFEKFTIRFKKMKNRMLFTGITIALVIIVILTACFIGQSNLRFFPVSTDKIEISEISQMQNGLVVFHLYINDDKPLYRLQKSVDHETNSLYITPRRALFEISWAPKEMKLLNDRYFYVAVDELYDDELEGFEYRMESNIDRIYIGTPKDSILVYERGMELPSASDEAEAAYENNGRILN